MSDPTPSLALVLVIGVCVGTGVYLMLERSLSRIIIGVILLGTGVNVLFLVAGGRAGGPPLYGTTEPEDMADPLVQFMVLTAIVITLGLTAFVLTMAYRSWQLHGHDEVQDDLEDRRIAQRLEREEPDRRADDIVTDLDTEAAEARDETEEDEPFDEPIRVAADGEDHASDRAAQEPDRTSEPDREHPAEADRNDDEGRGSR